MGEVVVPGVGPAVHAGGAVREVTVEGSASAALAIDGEGTPLEVLDRVLSSLTAPDLDGLPSPLWAGRLSRV